MGNPAQFVANLKSYDKDNIKEATLKKLKKFIEDERFTPENIKRFSVACMSITMWVKAMWTYSETLKIVVPLRKKLAGAEVEEAKANATLATKRKEL